MPRTKVRTTTKTNAKRSATLTRGTRSDQNQLAKRVAELERRVSLLEARQLEQTKTTAVIPSPVRASGPNLQSEPDLVHDIEKP